MGILYGYFGSGSGVGSESGHTELSCSSFTGNFIGGGFEARVSAALSILSIFNCSFCLSSIDLTIDAIYKQKRNNDANN